MDLFKFLLRALAVCLALAMACLVLPGVGETLSEFFLKCATVGALAAIASLLVAGVVKTKEALAFFGLWPR